MVEQLPRTGKAGVCRLSNYHGRPESYFARWTSFSGRPLAADVLAVISSHVERMKRYVDGMNRMSVSEQLTHFFEEIDMAIGSKEKKALQACNFSAHGLVYRNNINYTEQGMTSQVYECMLVRVILKLLNYAGDYIDYGTLGYPERNINCPIGNDMVENS